MSRTDSFLKGEWSGEGLELIQKNGYFGILFEMRGDMPLGDNGDLFKVIATFECLKTVAKNSFNLSQP
jgi:hypothetical protein